MISPHFHDDKEYMKRFVNEARAVASLNHPHIVKIYDVGGGTFPYFVMEFVDSPTMANVIERLGSLQESDIILYGSQLSNAFNYCHQNHVIHGDIKPSNLLIDKQLSDIKIIDFGIAKALKKHSNITQSDKRLGSPNYIAPEYFFEKKINEQTDIYSFGVTLYEMASGCLPFDTTNVVKRFTEEFVPLADMARNINPTLSKIIMKCIEIEPQNRYKSFQQIHNDITNIQF